MGSQIFIVADLHFPKRPAKTLIFTIFLSFKLLGNNPS